MTIVQDPLEAISVDEVGLATARHDGVVLRSAFQTVYAREGKNLLATAAESFLRPFRSGMPLPPRPFLAALDRAERAHVERIALRLHIANHANLEDAGLDHIIGLGAASAGEPGLLRQIEEGLAALPQDAEFDAWRLVCSIREAAAFDADGLPPLLEALAARKVRLALGGPLGEQPSLDAICRFSPAVVRIDGAWFRRVAQNESARRLLTSLMAGFRGDGRRVLIEGIETRAQLACALDAGADLFQGFLLSHPRLAGTAAEDRAIRLSDLLPSGGVVIPLFGGR